MRKCTVKIEPYWIIHANKQTRWELPTISKRLFFSLNFVTIPNYHQFEPVQIWVVKPNEKTSALSLLLPSSWLRAFKFSNFRFYLCKLPLQSNQRLTMEVKRKTANVECCRRLLWNAFLERFPFSLSSLLVFMGDWTYHFNRVPLVLC